MQDKVPTRLGELKQRLQPFKDWLRSSGAEVLYGTNPYEVLRFRTDRGTSIIYVKRDHRLTWTGEALDAYLHWLEKKVWRAVAKGKRPGKVSPTVRTLLERDGPECFYCGKVPETYSLEHLVAVTHGGPNHLSNYVLACPACNLEADHLSVVEKVKIRESKQNLIKGTTNGDLANQQEPARGGEAADPNPAGREGAARRFLPARDSRLGLAGGDSGGDVGADAEPDGSGGSEGCPFI